MNNLKPSTPVLHDENKHEFSIRLDHAPDAVVRYRLSQDQTAVDFYSTFVPDAYRGAGLAAILVDAAFEWAEKQELGINNSCSYARVKYQRRQKNLA